MKIWICTFRICYWIRRAKKKINSPTCNPSTFFEISYYHRFVHINAIGHTSPHDFCLFRRPWVVFVYSSKSWHDKKLGEMFLPLVLGIFSHFPLTKLRNKHFQPCYCSNGKLFSISNCILFSHLRIAIVCHFNFCQSK